MSDTTYTFAGSGVEQARSRAGAAHPRRDRRAARRPAARRALGVRARSRRHDPGRIRADGALLRRDAEPRTGAQDRRLSAPHPGRARRLAAVPRRRLRHERQREGLLRAQDDRRRHRCAAHEARARGDPRARRRASSRTCSRARCSRCYGVVPLAQRAGDAGRDHAAAEVVSVPPRQDLVLGAHRDRAAAGAAGAEAARRSIRAASRSTSCSTKTRKTVGAPHKAPHQKWSWFVAFRAIDIVLRALEPYMPKGLRKRAIDKAVAFVTERLNGEDGLGAIYPGDGELRDDVRRARLSGRPSASRDRARLARQAARRQGRRGLLPALRLAGVGHRAGRARAARSRRREGGRGREPRARLAQAPAGARREGRLGRAAPERAAGRLGVPVQQRALSRSRRHRRGRDGDGPRARRRAARRSIRRSTRGARMDRRPAEQERRLGRVRRRQRLPLPQQHPVRRSRRAARSADRGRHRALPLDAGAARRAAGDLGADAPRASPGSSAISIRREAGTAAGA